MNDEELMLACQRGSDRASNELVRRYRDKMYRLAYKILRNREDAEDAAQIALRKIFEKKMTFRHQSSVSTWIYAITQNEALMAYRRSRTPLISIDEPITSQDGEQFHAEMLLSHVLDPAELYEREVLLRLVSAAIESLDPTMRETFVLRVIYGLSNEEVARQLVISVAATKSRLHRAREALARHIRRSLGSRPNRGGS